MAKCVCVIVRSMILVKQTNRKTHIIMNQRTQTTFVVQFCQFVDRQAAFAVPGIVAHCALPGNDASESFGCLGCDAMRENLCYINRKPCDGWWRPWVCWLVQCSMHNTSGGCVVCVAFLCEDTEHFAGFMLWR